MGAFCCKEQQRKNNELKRKKKEKKSSLMLSTNESQYTAGSVFNVSIEYQSISSKDKVYLNISPQPIGFEPLTPYNFDKFPIELNAPQRAGEYNINAYILQNEYGTPQIESNIVSFDIIPSIAVSWEQINIKVKDHYVLNSSFPSPYKAYDNFYNVIYPSLQITTNIYEDNIFFEKIEGRYHLSPDMKKEIIKRDDGYIEVVVVFSCSGCYLEDYSCIMKWVNPLKYDDRTIF